MALVDLVGLPEDGVLLVDGSRLPRIGMGRILVQVDQFLDNHDGRNFTGSNPAELFKNKLMKLFSDFKKKTSSDFEIKVIKYG